MKYEYLQPYPATGDVLVFRTNLRNVHDLERISVLLNAEEKIIRWNVALDDSDKVLRVLSHRLSPTEVISLLIQAGFFCEELPD